MIDTVPKFQYPCYVDVCTFPDQFCNSGETERRCSQCTESLCHQQRRPIACQYFCIKLKEDDNPPSTAATAVSQLGFPGCGQTCLLVYCCVGITLVFFLLLAFLIVYIMRQQNLTPLSKSKSKPIQESGENLGSTEPATSAAPPYESVPLLAHPTSSLGIDMCVNTCSCSMSKNQSGSGNTPPPSYSTNDFPANARTEGTSLSSVATNTDDRSTSSRPSRNYHTNVTTDHPEGKAEKPWTMGINLDEQNFDTDEETNLKRFLQKGDRMMAPRPSE